MGGKTNECQKLLWGKNKIKMNEYDWKKLYWVETNIMEKNKSG